jgi:hypothetical protein
VGAAAVVDGDHAAVGGRVGVAARPDQRAQGPGQRQPEAAGAARAGRLPSHRRARAEVPVGPAADRLAAALGGHDPLAPEPDLPDGHRGFRVVVGVVVGGVGGHQARIVLGGRQHVADRQVTGPQPLVPRHPRRREQRGVPGQQDDLVEGHGVLARHPGQRDRPVPAGVTGLPAVEDVGEDSAGGRPAVDGLDLEPAVLADKPGVPRGLRCGLPGALDRGGQHLVGTGGQRLGPWGWLGHAGHCGR